MSTFCRLFVGIASAFVTLRATYDQKRRFSSRTAKGADHYNDDDDGDGENDDGDDYRYDGYARNGNL